MIHQLKCFALKKFYQNSLRFILVLDDITKLDITFILYKEAQEYLDKDSLAKILLDKEDLLEGLILFS